MQNRYAGDIGDYIKLALLRSISSENKLGVAWYLNPDEDHNSDGRHISYLNEHERWRHLDTVLFDHLAKTVSNTRSVCALERCLPANTIFHSRLIPTTMLPVEERSEKRTVWFRSVMEKLSSCDLVFADPDNGIVDNKSERRRNKNFGKQIPLKEVRRLSDGRTAVIYHHNSRRKGGHDAEVDKWLGLIGKPTIAVRATAYSCRTFFIVNPSDAIIVKTSEFCKRWKGNKVRLHHNACGCSPMLTCLSRFRIGEKTRINPH